MSDPLRGWKTVPLGEVCDYARGLTYKKADEVEVSSNAVLRANNIDQESGQLNLEEIRYIREDIDIPEKKKLKQDSLLICTASGSRKHLGKIAHIEEEMDYAFGGFMGLLTPKPELLSRFFFYVTRSDLYTEFIESLSQGMNINNLKWSQLQEFEIPLPPLSEQRRIVSVLDAAFAGLATATAHTQKNLQNARELFDSHLESIFEKQYLAGSIVELKEIASDVTDGDHLPPPKSDEGIPFITIRNIDKQSRAIDFDNSFRVPQDYYDGLKHNRKPRLGDVLYTVTGSYGVTVEVTDDIPFCFQRHIALVRPAVEVSSGWLRYLLESPQVRKQADERANGTAQKTVSLKVLRSFQVPKVHYDDQLIALKSITTLGTQVDQIALNCERKLAALSELKQSLLHRAFRGELSGVGTPAETVAS